MHMGLLHSCILLWCCFGAIHLLSKRTICHATMAWHNSWCLICKISHLRLRDLKMYYSDLNMEWCQASSPRDGCRMMRPFWQKKTIHHTFVANHLQGLPLEAVHILVVLVAPTIHPVLERLHSGEGEHKAVQVQRALHWERTLFWEVRSELMYHVHIGVHNSPQGICNHRIK